MTDPKRHRSDEVRFRGFEFVVGEGDRGKRLDQLLAAHVPDLSRRKARVLLDIGGVFVDGARTKVAGRALRPGQVVVANLGGALDRASKEPGREARARDDARMPVFRVVHEDADLVVVDKPSGVLTAPTPESDRQNLARAVSDKLGRAVFVVHRLDLETSGLLVLARTDEANRVLAERFREHDIERSYLAGLAGVVEQDSYVLDALVGGRPALTRLEVLERRSGVTLARCTLETGRTHQIRLHAQGLGHPVLGDRRYGAPTAFDPPRMALHAAVLGFAHPVTGAPLRFELGWPDDLASWVDALHETEAG